LLSSAIRCAHLSQEAGGPRPLCYLSPARQPAASALPPGAATWSEDQSRKNFEVWKRFVVPGEPMRSIMLLHPLAKDAGGDRFHAGGKHFLSQNDPEWQILAAWVNGQTNGCPK
jgi:hypothetical protein